METFLMAFLIGVISSSCSGNSRTAAEGDGTDSDSHSEQSGDSDTGDSDSGQSGDSDTQGDTGEPVDSETSDAGNGTDEETEMQTDSADAGDTETKGDPAAFGFDIRLPQTHTVSCDGPTGSLEFTETDADWICTFAYDGTNGHIYLTNDLVSCVALMSAVPVFEANSAFISVDGAVSPLDGSIYDIGGNHHNDFLELDYNGFHFRYYHSSFGFGWRACSPMDCMQVYDSGGTLIEDGCTVERTLPVTCAEVQADGTYAPLVDTFAPCPGDANYEDTDTQ